ncbi:hypothetical protein BC830DRAFT_1149200 [Chytriomyces sp. MP71]|nr:hypothetical protein BC830DRAFT_1149200 [Chytriomyces sp. MP71]
MAATRPTAICSNPLYNLIMNTCMNTSRLATTATTITTARSSKGRGTVTAIQERRPALRFRQLCLVVVVTAAAKSTAAPTSPPTFSATWPSCQLSVRSIDHVTCNFPWIYPVAKSPSLLCLHQLGNLIFFLPNCIFLLFSSKLDKLDPYFFTLTPPFLF